MFKKQAELIKWLVCLLCLCSCFFAVSAQEKNSRPNVIIIYTDDLGYGDLSCYGATRIQTPNIDQLAQTGIRFTNAHTTSATCTPSRFALMTGIYPWRKKGTGVLPGDARLIVPTDKITLPKVFKEAGYTTGIVGKWHLGLDTTVEKNWNAAIHPGPNETGFDYSFIFPATADRVPTVFLEYQLVVDLDASDPIQVNYNQETGDEPTGAAHPELLKMKASPNHGHNNTIVNGIGRIGYMRGGRKARWVDEELGFTFLAKAQTFIRKNKSAPFFLYYALTEPHVPRMPATMFKGSSGLGYRGDAILQIDWAVGQLMQQLEMLGLKDNTMIIFSSDNGPVLDDGYEDDAITKLNGHTPAGALRGGKYSIFEAGTRVPFIVNWPAITQPGTSAALMSQIDLLASFAAFLKIPVPEGQATDSENNWSAFMGKGNGRALLVEHAQCLALVKENWKYIEPGDGPPLNKLTHTELGNLNEPQLYDLTTDIGEKNNLAKQNPKKVNAMKALLQAIKDKY